MTPEQFLYVSVGFEALKKAVNALQTCWVRADRNPVAHPLVGFAATIRDSRRAA
jgi:hypothetical protein